MTKLYDYTQLAALLECETEWDYRYRQHLARPTAEVSPHFGTAVHSGVRALFDGQPREAVADAVSVAWGDFVAPEKKAHLNLSYAQQVVEMYGNVYGLCNGYSFAPWGKSEECGSSPPPVAQPFDLVLNERYLEWPECSLCGIVDRVVRSKADGQLYVMDLKTSGLYLSQAFFEQYRHSLQAAIYLNLVEHEMQSWDASELSEQFHGPRTVAGFWVDAIHLDRRGYPKREDFSRVGPFSYSAALREELRTLTHNLVVRAQHLDWVPEDAPQKNPRSCFRFQSLCPFFRFCTLDPSDRKDAVRMALSSGDFQEVPWEPSKRL